MKVHLALAIHNHQPVGNFDWIFENAVQYAYEPMIAALERHPGVRLALHYSGPLRDWLAQHRPDLFKRIRALVKNGQVEMLTGGYYEPVLIALPDVDKLGQIKKMTAAVKKDFGYDPTGIWLAERVWEPHLPMPLAQAGVQYTILDDTHFRSVGLGDDELGGYYVTEEQGYMLKVFGSSRYLRFATPWSPVNEIIEWLRSQADASGTRVVVMGDDGEKFGLWPGTCEHCWTNCWDSQTGWVEQFFAALEANADWLITMPPGECAAAFPPQGRAYLPTAAYEEMMVWALPAEASADLMALRNQLQDESRHDVLQFLRGGLWRGFMSKYPEVNAMHKKMLYVSDKVHRIRQRATRTRALDALWASQCNCPYWHGVFGGVYLFHIREATYEKLIAAETLADRAAHEQETWAEAHVTDLNKDGQDEVILSSDAQNLVFEPAQGGALVEWDWRAIGVNLVNTLTRRPEGYHRLLRDAAERGELALTGQAQTLTSLHGRQVRVKELGLEDRLCYDWYRRVSLLDHLLPESATLEEYSCNRYAELGDFVTGAYQFSVDSIGDRVILRLSRDGQVKQAGVSRALRIEKTITLIAGQLALEVVYRLVNLCDDVIAARFGVETNWGLAGSDGPQAYSVWPGGNLVRLNALHEVHDVAEAALVNEWFGRIVIGCERKAGWWQAPIETISNSDAGFERMYQGTSLLTFWPLELAPAQEWQAALRFKLA